MKIIKWSDCEFVGAVGKYEKCHCEIELDKNDFEKIDWENYRVYMGRTMGEDAFTSGWIVNCPECKTLINCQKGANVDL